MGGFISGLFQRYKVMNSAGEDGRVPIDLKRAEAGSRCKFWSPCPSKNCNFIGSLNWSENYVSANRFSLCPFCICFPPLGSFDLSSRYSLQGQNDMMNEDRSQFLKPNEGCWWILEKWKITLWRQGRIFGLLRTCWLRCYLSAPGK